MVKRFKLVSGDSMEHPRLLLLGSHREGILLGDVLAWDTSTLPSGVHVRFTLPEGITVECPIEAVER